MKRPAVTATALGLSRNEAGRRFPHAEDPAVLEDLRSEVVDVLTGGQWEQRWQVYELEVPRATWSWTIWSSAAS